MRAKVLLVDVESVMPKATVLFPLDPFKLDVIHLARVTNLLLMGFLNSAGKPT